MPETVHQFRFEVAFSYAGPHREKVREIAECVAATLGRDRVFFDRWHEPEILGDDMDVLLQRFYGKQSLLVLADISAEYGESRWCQAEARAIRNLRFSINAARDETQRLRFLNLRLGEGEVVEEFRTSGYLDATRQTPRECAELILERLELLHKRLAPPEPVPKTDFAWPETPEPLAIWPMADHTRARAAFEQLLTRRSPWQCLLLKGDTETGKSHITRQMLANAIKMPELACGRLDFKGTTGIEAEVRALVECLELPVPPANLPLNERLHQVLDALKARGRSALLIFDSYEAAGEAQDWVEGRLLLRAMRYAWLRVVIAGQNVPKTAGATWESVVQPPLEIQPPSAEEWYAYGRQHKAGISLEFVQEAYRLCHGKASVLAQLLGPEH